MLIGTVNSGHRDSFQLLSDFFGRFPLSLKELFNSLKKSVFSDHFVSDVQLNDRSIV